MKKVLSIIALTLVLALSMSFFGCSLLGGGTGGGKEQITSQSAIEINRVAKTDDAFTYDELVAKYGTPYKNKYNSGMGYVTWINCEVEEVDQKVENGEKIAALEVTFYAGKATGATFTDDYFG